MTTPRLQPDPAVGPEAGDVVAAVATAFSAKVVGQADLRESMLLVLLSGGTC